MKKNMNLNEIGNRNPFSVPDNYFEQFAVQFDAQIGVGQKPTYKLVRSWMYVAALFLGVVFLSRFAYTTYTNNKVEATEDYELYVMTQVNDVENLDYSYQEVNEK